MKPLLRNPFLTRPIKWSEPFCNREKELQTLIREAKDSGLVVLYGPRRCGKTSILNQLEGRLGKDWIRIELDFTFKSKKIRKALAAKKYHLRSVMTGML
jgi:predicted AAA+ superfamily ATPase